jgi:hypothetical protein
MLFAVSSMKAKPAIRLMSTSTDGRSRRKLSIGTRLCPPAMILASAPAAANEATAMSILSATT